MFYVSFRNVNDYKETNFIVSYTHDFDTDIYDIITNNIGFIFYHRERRKSYFYKKI